MLLNCVAALAVLYYVIVTAREAGAVGNLLRSAKFQGILVSAFLFGGVIAVVNLYAPEKKVGTYLIAADTLSAHERDTTAQNLKARNSRFHYQLLQKLITFKKHESTLKAVADRYLEFHTAPIRTKEILASMASLPWPH